jgi:DNA-directed RNA polymerase alpha subunit
MEKQKVKILEQPIEQLNLSQESKAYLKNSGFNNLKEVIETGWQGLRELKDFDYLRFNELVRFLDSCNLIHLLDKQNINR